MLFRSVNPNHIVNNQVSPFVFGTWFTFAKNANITNPSVNDLRWFTVQNLAPVSLNQTTFDLGIYQVRGATFPLNPLAQLENVGSAKLRFHNCTEASLEFSMNSNSFVGAEPLSVIRLERVQPPQRCHENDQNQAEISNASLHPINETIMRNFGRSGIWSVPGSGGHGIFIEQNSNVDLPFLGWFTSTTGVNSWLPDSQRLRWFTLQPVYDGSSRRATGAYDSNGTLNLRIYLSAGGTFGITGNSTATEVGTASLQVVSGGAPGPCNSLSFTYAFNNTAAAGEFAGLNNIGSPYLYEKLGAPHPLCTTPEL